MLKYCGYCGSKMSSYDKGNKRFPYACRSCQKKLENGKSRECKYCMTCGRTMPKNTSWGHGRTGRGVTWDLNGCPGCGR